MSSSIAMVQGAILPDHCAPWWADEHGRRGLAAGALLAFDGVVRAREGDGQVIALDYEAYEPMASRQLHAIAERMEREHAILALACWHSVGRVRVGEASLRVQLAGKHRAEVIVALSAFIDSLKKDVPIWKSPVWSV